MFQIESYHIIHIIIYKYLQIIIKIPLISLNKKKRYICFFFVGYFIAWCKAKQSKAPIKIKKTAAATVKRFIIIIYILDLIFVIIIRTISDP